MSLNKILINDTTTVNTGIVYDISKAHNGSTYTDLADALGTNGTNVPLEVREGGMSVKFIQTSNNKYVQYRLMSTSFSTNEADWQSVMSAADKNLLDYYNNSRGHYLEVNYSGELDYSADEVNLGTAYHGPLDDIETTTVILRASTTEQAGVMSAADKLKLEGISAGAEVNQNAFSKVNVGRATIIADNKTDVLHFKAGTNVTITASGVGNEVTIAAQDTTYDVATTSANGLMSAADKTKLDEIVSLKGDIPPLSEEELDEILADDDPSVFPPMGDFEE